MADKAGRSPAQGKVSSDHPQGRQRGPRTMAPTSKLHVVGNSTITGNITVDGNIAAKYQGVAEWVDAAEPLEAGTMVVIDEIGKNRVTAAARECDSRVAGAVSPQPGWFWANPETAACGFVSGRMRATGHQGGRHRRDEPDQGARDALYPRQSRQGLDGPARHGHWEGIGAACDWYRRILVLLTLQCADRSDNRRHRTDVSFTDRLFVAGPATSPLTRLVGDGRDVRTRGTTHAYRRASQRGIPSREVD